MLAGDALAANAAGIKSSPENVIEATNAKELQIADTSKLFVSGKTGGEMVDKEDLWSCLFGKIRKSNDRGLPNRGIAGLGATADMPLIDASSEVGRFLRYDAAERRAEACE